MAVKTPIDSVPTNGLFGVSDFLELYLTTSTTSRFPIAPTQPAAKKLFSLASDEENFSSKLCRLVYEWKEHKILVGVLNWLIIFFLRRKPATIHSAGDGLSDTRHIAVAAKVSKLDFPTLSSVLLNTPSKILCSLLGLMVWPPLPTISCEKSLPLWAERSATDHQHAAPNIDHFRQSRNFLGNFQLRKNP